MAFLKVVKWFESFATSIYLYIFTLFGLCMYIYFIIFTILHCSYKCVKIFNQRIYRIALVIYITET